MAKMFGKLRLTDYDQWKPIFESMRSTRQKFGSTGEKLFRAEDNRNEVLVVVDWETVDQAKKFGESQELKDAMKRGGVVDLEMHFVD